MIRVLIVAASARARRALESRLSTQGMEVVGSFPTMEGAAEVSEENEPDVVLVDAGDDSLDGLLESLQGSSVAHQTPVLLLGNVAREGVSRALRLGVRGILSAETPRESLAIAVDAVSHGLLVLDPREAAAVPAAMGEAAAELPEPLTPREKEVLRLLAAGLGNKEIAARLNISDHTAKFHVASILGKLAASSRTEAVSIGMRRGLILF